MHEADEQPYGPRGVPPKERKLAYALVPPAVVVLVMWCTHLLGLAYQLDLYRFGVHPRHADGLVGIATAPFIHGDFEHLLNNSIPLLVLGWALLYFFPRLSGRVVLGSWLISGLLVWATARGNYHIGASGVVYGLAAFLFTSGLLRKQRTLMGLSLLVVFLYGSLLWGVFPIIPRISWESHFWGAAAGVVMAYLFKEVPSAVQDPKPIVWDDEEEEPAQSPDLLPSAADDADVDGARSWRSTDTWNHGGPENRNPATRG